MHRLSACSALVLTVLLSGLNGAYADQAFDACVRKLCTNTEQGDCWIKAGANLCKEPGKQCSEVEDHAAAKVINKIGKWWHMETAKGAGFINERYMMVSGDQC